jgi:hypothetical protein
MGYGSCGGCIMIMINYDYDFISWDIAPLKPTL